MWLGKIPGHSGTQFKRRQSFRLVKDFQDKEAKNHHVSVKVSNSFREHNLKYRKYSRFIPLIAIAIFLCGLLYMAQTVKFNSVYISSQLLISQDFLDINDPEYRLFSSIMKKANILLENQMIPEALVLYEKAQVICPDELEPNVGIYQCIKILCKEKDLYCSITTEYHNYLVSIKYFKP